MILGILIDLLGLVIIFVTGWLWACHLVPVNEFKRKNEMRTLKKIWLVVASATLKFYSWAKTLTEFYIALMAGVVWFAFWLGSLFFGTETYPVGYFQKICFGILAMSIISGVTFFWLRKTQPFYANLLDPDTQGGINNLTEWEKIKVGLFWFAFFGLGTVLLASLY